MSDTPQGPDWWQASDDKWYPPPRPEMPGDADATAVSPSGPVPPAGPVAGPPTGPPTGPPSGPPSGGYPPAGGFPPAGPQSGGFPPGAAPSPYGGMPPGAQPPGQQNKTPLYVAIGVVAAAALVGLIVILSSGGDDDPQTQPTGSPGSTAAPAPPTTEPGPDDPTTDTTPSDPDDPEPSGDNAVVVVDEGFQPFMGGYDQDERTASYGFILENTSDEVATDISISVSAFDASGTALASASHNIYVLRPGERMGIGDEFYGENFATDVDDVQIQVSEPSEYGLDDVPDDGTVTAEGINTTSDEYGLATTFTARSTYGEQLDSPQAYAIYRDAAGKIIGGSTGYVDFIAANGSTAGEVTSWDLIPNVASTEVYIDPGYFY